MAGTAGAGSAMAGTAGAGSAMAGTAGAGTAGADTEAPVAGARNTAVAAAEVPRVATVNLADRRLAVVARSAIREFDRGRVAATPAAQIDRRRVTVVRPAIRRVARARAVASRRTNPVGPTNPAGRVASGRVVLARPARWLVVGESGPSSCGAVHPASRRSDRPSGVPGVGPNPPRAASAAERVRTPGSGSVGSDHPHHPPEGAATHRTNLWAARLNSQLLPVALERV